MGEFVPIARTNVALEGVNGHQIHAFTYTVSAPRPEPTRTRTFVVAAVPESRGPEVMAAGDTTPEGLRRKTALILDTIESRMEAMGVGWGDATGAQLYTTHDLRAVPTTLVRPRLAAMARHGIQLHHALPPVLGLEVELDVRSTGMELVLDA